MADPAPVAPILDRLRADPIRYVRKSVTNQLTEVELAPRATAGFAERQVLRDFTTHQHHPGKHRVEVQVNGAVLGAADFVLLR